MCQTTPTPPIVVVSSFGITIWRNTMRAAEVPMVITYGPGGGCSSCIWFVPFAAAEGDIT